MAGINGSPKLPIGVTLTASMKNRVTLALALALTALICPACKQQPPAPQTGAETSAAHDPWLTDFEAAQTKARAEKKMVFVDFTGSDWCPPCKALHKNVLMAKEFLDYANDNLVLVMVDFPQSKPQSEELKRSNKELSEKFEIEGFPTVLVLSSEGKQLSKEVGYDGAGPRDFVAKLKNLK